MNNQNPVDLGEALSELIDMLIQMKKEQAEANDPEKECIA